MKKYFASLGIICGLAMTSAGLAQAANVPGSQPPAPPYYNNYLPYQGNYTPQQWEEARRVFDENNAALTPIRQELTSKRGILDQELAKQNPDLAIIEKLSREIGELRGKMLSARISARNRLTELGLPSDCYGPCNMNYRMGCWGDYYYPDRGYWHHGPSHGGHGHRGYWR